MSEDEPTLMGELSQLRTSLDDWLSSRKNSNHGGTYTAVSNFMNFNNKLEKRILFLDSQIKILKEEGNRIFKFNDFLSFFNGLLKSRGITVENMVKKHCFVFRDDLLKTPMEVF